MVVGGERLPAGLARDLSLTPPPITEDPYLSLDAMILGDLLISILNHTDRIKIACLSLLVNVSAPILTEPGGAAVRQPIFHPFAAAAHLAVGSSLRTAVDCGSLPTGRHGDVPAVAAAATFDRETGRAAVFLANRAPEATTVAVDHRALGGCAVISARTLLADGEGELVPFEQVEAGGGAITAVVPGESWTVLELKADGAW